MGSRAYWPDRAWGGGGQAAATWPRTRSIPPTPPARLRPQRRAPRGRTGQRSGGSRTRTTAESPAPAPRPPAGRAYGRGSRASRRRSRLQRARASPRRRSPWGKLPVTTPGAVRLVVRAGCAHAPHSSKVISFSFTVSPPAFATVRSSSLISPLLSRLFPVDFYMMACGLRLYAAAATVKLIMGPWWILLFSMHRRRNEEGGDSSETLKADMFPSNCSLQLAFVNSSPAILSFQKKKKNLPRRWWPPVQERQHLKFSLQ